MRRPLDAAEPARHTLLGLLLVSPSHGYDLARAFAPGTPLGSVVHLGASHLYALLGQLERDGLVEGIRAEQGARPPRRVYRITDQGRSVLWRWLDEPVARPRDLTLDFSLKLYLARRLDPERAVTLVHHQRDLFAAYLRDLQQEQVPEGSPDDRAFMRLMLDGRIARTRSALEWLDRCAAVAGRADRKGE